MMEKYVCYVTEKITMKSGWVKMISCFDYDMTDIDGQGAIWQRKGTGEEDVLICLYIQLQTDKNISNS